CEGAIYMKKPALVSVCFLGCLILFASGCHFNYHQVAGSGNRQTQKRDVAPFSSIASLGAFEITVVSQKPVSLEIEGDDNILPLISTEVSNNVLHIKTAQNYSTHEPIKVRLAVPNLEGMSVTGAGKVSITGVKNEKFELNANGAPNISVEGETGLVNI